MGDLTATITRVLKHLEIDLQAAMRGDKRNTGEWLGTQPLMGHANVVHDNLPVDPR